MMRSWCRCCNVILVLTTLVVSVCPLAISVQQENHQVGRKGKTMVIAGATGYIGKAVVRESVRRGYNTVALVRDVEKIKSPEGKAKFDDFFHGAQLIQCDVANQAQLAQTMQETTKQYGTIESIVSCLASRSGIKKDAYAIDYLATLHLLNSARDIRARHFVLLSAFCVRNPLLQFQHAKLKFEAALQEQSDLTWSIVRPTAYFKSLTGQLDKLKSGERYLTFGNGDATRCNPISETDLATYLIDCIDDKSRENKILNVGGSEEAVSHKKLGQMMFKALGKEPKYFHVPLWLFDVIINTLQWMANIFEYEAFENGAEAGRIVKYYATESMLTTEPEEKFGTMTLQEHYNTLAVEGQEYDPNHHAGVSTWSEKQLSFAVSMSHSLMWRCVCALKEISRRLRPTIKSNKEVIIEKER